MVTDKQVQLLFKYAARGWSISIVAAKAGMCEKTGRKYLQLRRLPSQLPKKRNWRTRANPLGRIWGEIEGMLEKDFSLQATTIFNFFRKKNPDLFGFGQLRTLQRRVRDWRMSQGLHKEVMFEQRHFPGQSSQSDFTSMNDLGVSIKNKPFKHLFYHFILPYSNWETGSVCHVESFESLSTGLQDALWELGGTPREHRTDHLTAAVVNLGDKRRFTENYNKLLSHYGLKGSRNRPGKPHENGDIEQSHYRFKAAVKQALLLRGCSNFDSRVEYETFLKEIIRRRNRMRRHKTGLELSRLKILPKKRLEDPYILTTTVSSASTIRVCGNIYSVPSCFISKRLTVNVHPSWVEVFYGKQSILRATRSMKKGEAFINYRHIIHSLVKKPGAFRNYVYRDQQFPCVMFRKVYKWLHKTGRKNVDSAYLKVLLLAAEHGQEKVARACRQVLELVKVAGKMVFTPNEKIGKDTTPLDLANALVHILKGSTHNPLHPICASSLSCFDN